MDPFLAVEFWWIVPVVIGAGTAGVIGVRMSGRRRRLAFDAARRELAVARADAVAKTAALRAARARVAQVTAERGAGTASDADLTGAKRHLHDADRSARAAVALVRARRAQLAAARAEMSTPGDPLDRLRAAHDAVVARWMEYETDPAKAIAFPQMSDARMPATATFLRAQERAALARPASDARKVTPEQFSEYRAAILEMERAFVEAERASGAVSVPRPAWQDTAQSVIERSVDAIRSATDAWTNRRRD